MKVSIGDSAISSARSEVVVVNQQRPLVNLELQRLTAEELNGELILKTKIHARLSGEFGSGELTYQGSPQLSCEFKSIEFT